MHPSVIDGIFRKVCTLPIILSEVMVWASLNKHRLETPQCGTFVPYSYCENKAISSSDVQSSMMLASVQIHWWNSNLLKRFDMNEIFFKSPFFEKTLSIIKSRSDRNDEAYFWSDEMLYWNGIINKNQFFIRLRTFGNEQNSWNTLQRHNVELASDGIEECKHDWPKKINKVEILGHHIKWYCLLIQNGVRVEPKNQLL